MKLLPNQKPVDKQEDNEQTYWVSTLDESDGLRNMHQWTRTEINKALAKGIGIEAETDNARNLPELKPMKSGHSEKSKPPKKKKLTDVKERAYAKSRVTARGGSESGAGKGGYAFSLQDRANGGKARAASMTKKQRQESAKKAVLARWAKTKRTKR